MKNKLIGYCGKCNNLSFRFEKKVEGNSKKDIFTNEVFNHDGYGFDLNTFNIICAKCGNKNADRFKFKNDTHL